jgi:undecaprenyl-diphosphatase
MDGAQVSVVFSRLDQAELRWCQQFNRACRRPGVQCFFATISRLGNGTFWYALMLYVATTQGRAGCLAAVHMALVGTAGLALYTLMKPRLSRERPFVAHTDIAPGAAPLDRYSFPSGHTLHAVAFSMVAMRYFPVLAWIVVPFAALTAVSRIALGLHYPSDVMAGAVLGVALAQVSFCF